MRHVQWAVIFVNFAFGVAFKFKKFAPKACWVEQKLKRTCASGYTLSPSCGIGLKAQYKNNNISTDGLKRRVKKAVRRNEYNRAGLASPQVHSYPAGVSQVISSLFLFHQHVVSGVNRPAELQRLTDADVVVQIRNSRQLSRSEQRGTPSLGERSEPSRGRSNDCLTSVSHPPTSRGLTAPRCLH